MLPLIQELRLLFSPFKPMTCSLNSSCSVKSGQTGVMIIHYIAGCFCSSWDCCAIYPNLCLTFRWVLRFGIFWPLNSFVRPVLTIPVSLLEVMLRWVFYSSLGSLSKDVFLAAWECDRILLHSGLWASHFYDSFCDARYLSPSGLSRSPSRTLVLCVFGILNLGLPSSFPDRTTLMSPPASDSLCTPVGLVSLPFVLSFNVLRRPVLLCFFSL